MKLNRLKWTFVLLGILALSDSLAQRLSGGYTFAIDDQLDERIYAIDKLEFFEETGNSLDIATVSHPDFQGNFKTNPAFSKGKFDPNKTYWVKVSILRNPASQKNWILEFYDQTIDHLDAYLPQNQGGFRKVELGDERPFSQRLFSHKNFEIPVSNVSEGITNYYFKIRSSQKADIRIAFRSVNRFVFYSLSEYFLYGIFYGMILIITLYNLLIYVAIREIKYLYYVFYLLSVAGFAMAADGIGFQYLWPNSPEWNSYVNGIFGFGIVAFAIFFSIRFLNLKLRHRLLYQLLRWFLVAKSILFLAGLAGVLELLEVQVYDILPFLLILVASILVLVKGYKVARLFVAAYAILVLGVLLKILVHTAVIPHSTVLYYSLHMAFLIEMLLLTLALGDRVKILKETKDRALLRSLRQAETNAQLKDKVNAELEQKVADRTFELEEKSRLLEAYNTQILEKDEEIKRINSLLDKDIWKLKSKMKESLRNQITNKKLTYEEFKVIFPDATACYRYLEEIKWSEGFTCKSCGQSKEAKAPKLFHRRCGSCGHIESPTAGTIFHGIRIPLEKAFYLVYLVVSEQDQMTLEQLSHLLDLRVNAISNFKIKVRTAKISLGKTSPEWEEFLIDPPVMSLN
ncbi:7TM diverse intracellular signaling domain-containing protein [Algoriphagus hitonicola]|uniref:7TMR-DISM extracellular 2 n=1 Tax=Algoriphagus hitonicola TaxID=435880 RepID=A0A1I2VSS6_9BACT|nr:7TM diverse intracellular signaling domain-containing protein [Algoriphagus hitonicola]SFG92202.1 7TMR-DISM extracellular 2 [Algoriphagus hitonicola]